MRAMSAEGFSGYKDLKVVDIPKPAVSDGRVLVRNQSGRGHATRAHHSVGGIPTGESTTGLGWRESRRGGGGRGNGLSCRFACDVYGAVWCFRVWTHTIEDCCQSCTPMYESHKY